MNFQSNLRIHETKKFTKSEKGKIEFLERKTANTPQEKEKSNFELIPESKHKLTQPLNKKHTIKERNTCAHTHTHKLKHSTGENSKGKKVVNFPRSQIRKLEELQKRNAPCSCRGNGKGVRKREAKIEAFYESKEMRSAHRYRHTQRKELCSILNLKWLYAYTFVTKTIP